MLGMKNSRRKVPSTNTVTINNDILENNILPRLPVKSLFRFRCVCKRWGSLLTADSIFSLQKPLSLKPPSGLVYWNEKRLAFLSTDGRPMNVPDPKLSFLGEFVSVTNSCNGLICGFYVREGLWPEIYVCNPVTKQVRSTRMPKRGLIVGLAFDPSSPNPHYKLMCPFIVYRNASHNEYGFNLFLSSTGMWRESKERIRISPQSVVTGRSFFVDGVLYFKATNDVIWFQIDNDLAGVVPLPLSDKMITATLGEYKSKLSYIQITISDIEIWTLKNFHWKKKRCVGLDLLDVYCRPKVNVIDHLKKILKTLEANYRTRQSFRPLPLALDDIFLFQVGAKAYFYNMRTSEVSMICQSDRMMGNFFTCLPYTNSFVPIPE